MSGRGRIVLLTVIGVSFTAGVGAVMMFALYQAPFRQ